MSALTDFLTSIADAIRARKGATEPIPAPNYVAEIETLVYLKPLENPALAEHIAAGYEAYDANGNKITGTLEVP